MKVIVAPTVRAGELHAEKTGREDWLIATDVAQLDGVSVEDYIPVGYTILINSDLIEQVELRYRINLLRKKLIGEL